MNPNLQTAILEFLGNEFKLDPQKILYDLNFLTDLNLHPDQLADLLSRMQDALNFTIPEEKIESITTVAELFEIITESEEETSAYDDQTD